MAYMSRGRALWSRRNAQEQAIIKLSPDYAGVLRGKRPELVRIVEPGGLWPHLRKYQVVDEAVLQRIQLNATPHDMVDRLLDHLECGPTYRLHAFLRACYLTDQCHVISHVGFDEEKYAGDSPPESDSEETPAAGASTPGVSSTAGAGVMTQSTSASNTEGQPQPQLLLPGRLRDVLMAHSGSYKHHIMFGKVFDFKHGDSEMDMYDVNECHIEQDADFQQYKRVAESIQIGDILKPFKHHSAPRTVLLVGPPGAGKSTFFKHFAYVWSQEFLQFVQGLGRQQHPDLLLVVYVPARLLTPDIWGSIEGELCCKEDGDKGFLMKEVKAGKLNDKSAIFLDGLDEVRDKEVLRAIRAFIESKHKDGGPQIIASARTGLSRVDKSSFDRFLHLEGFTMEEGLRYVNKYVTLHSQHGSSEAASSSSHTDPILSYINRNKDKLSPILQNPLRAHILSGLAVEGLIELDDNNILQSVELLMTMENFFIQRETEGRGVPTAEREKFYKLCLFGLLEDIREFSEDHLKMFNVQDSAYVSFLRRHTRRNKFASNVTFYQFEHEMLFEYFGARAIETLGKGMKEAIILHVCSQSILRNLQKLLFGILSEFGTENSVPLMIVMTRLILLKQALRAHREEERKPKKKGKVEQFSDDPQICSYKEWDEFVSNLQTLFNSIKRTIPRPRDILLKPDIEGSMKDQRHGNRGRRRQQRRRGAQGGHVHPSLSKIWDMVNTTFSQLTDLTKMNQSRYGEEYWEKTYFNDGKNEFLIELVEDLLSECTPQQQTEIADSSYLLMLPCSGYYPSGNMWWVYVSSISIRCWSPEDIPEAVTQCRKSSTVRVTRCDLNIDFNTKPSQRGNTPDKHWTCAVWDRALRAVESKYSITGRLCIDLGYGTGTPIKGLLYSLTGLNMSLHVACAIDIVYGTITLEELHQWYQESGGNRMIALDKPTLQLPDDEQTRKPLMQWAGTPFREAVKQSIVDNGQIKGYLHFKPYAIECNLSLYSPQITFV